MSNSNVIIQCVSSSLSSLKYFSIVFDGEHCVHVAVNVYIVDLDCVNKGVLCSNARGKVNVSV